VGLKLLAESWLDVSPMTFISLDASYGTDFREYWSLARIGRRLRPKLSLGLEGGAQGNEEYNAGRAGGFVRLNLRGIAMTISSGFTGNYLEAEPSGCLSLGLYRAFQILGKCTAGPAPAVLGLIGVDFAAGRTGSIRFPRGGSPICVVRSVPESRSSVLKRESL
jgi:cellulose biosynthesis protein BcsS